MSDFDKLKQMDIDEIHQKTRITKLQLLNILNKKFDNIDSTIAHGFIKILERELRLDLNEWLKEYDEYKKINISKKSNYIESNTMQKEIQIDSNDIKVDTLQDYGIKSIGQDVYTNKDNHINDIQQNKKITNNKHQLNSMNIEISMPKQQISYKTIIIAISSIIIVLLIIFGIYMIDSNNTQKNSIAEQNNTQKQAVEKDIKQTYPTISLYDAINDKEQNIEKISTKNNEMENINKDSMQRSVTQMQGSEEHSKQQAKINADNNNEVLLTITPKQDVWFAWMDTITKTRGEKYTNKTPITITIKNPTIFHFGYANLSIDVNGQKFEYNKKGVTYMLYDKEQGIKFITQKEYRALGGR